MIGFLVGFAVAWMSEMIKEYLKKK